MRYVSTRGSAEADGATAVINGIAPDGGLYVPDSLPELRLSDFSGDYISRADRVLREFFDFDISGVAKSAYGGNMFDGDPAPVVKLDDNMFFLELWHGRTSAFKDMALSVLPRLTERAKLALGRTEKTLVLVATSGDTGKAALEGFANVSGTECCVFYPTDGVSTVQKLAMQTQEGGNVRAIGVNGNFDDAQRAVKAAMNDGVLIKALGDNNIALSSANSINIGRLVPQIVYYFSAYADLVDSGEIKNGEKIDFVVPTGNFGNILAGYYAREMGLPVNRLVCASNSNNVLTDFFKTGEYDKNREFHKTASPSMDILVSSNLERLIFETSGRDGALTAKRMESLSSTGRYSLSPSEIEGLQSIFSADYATDEQAAEAINEVFEDYGYLMDTHTAVAYAVAARRCFPRPTVIVSTADPFKFAPAVLRALGEKADAEATPEMLAELEELSAMDAPNALKNVFTKPVRFCDTVEPDGITELIQRTYCEEKAEQ